MTIPKPMPVLIVSSRCLNAARIESQSASLILPRLTSRSISSTIADQRSVAFISGMICSAESRLARDMRMLLRAGGQANRSEEHTSELQSRRDLVCRLLLEKKKELKNVSYAQE